MTRFRTFITLIAAVLMLALPLAAQEQTAGIQGTVTDASGSVLPGVTVEATSPNLAGTQSTVTDAKGKYRFPSLPPGVYKVTATLDGFSPASVPNIRLALGNNPSVDLTMQVGQVAEAIVVTGEAPMVDTTRSATATSIRGEALTKLPKGRDFTSVVTQASGASIDARAGGISIEGASGSENRYVIDGADTTNPKDGLSGKALVTDFVEEVQVKSAGYAAEFGGAIGGVINVITKTGSNDFQGDIGGYYTNDSLRGSERLTLRRADSADQHAESVKYNKDGYSLIQPGFSLGGPIVRDRLWFFAAYQPTLESFDRTVNFTTGAVRSYSADVKQFYGTANVNGNIGSKLLYKIAANYSPTKASPGYINPTTNFVIFPNRNGRSDPNADYGQGYETKNIAYSGYLDFVASNSLVAGLHGGHFLTDYKDTGIPNQTRYIFGATAGRPSDSFPGFPAQFDQAPGYQSILTNTAYVRDKFTRDNIGADASLFVSLLGEHSFKVGYQYEKLGNDVFNGEQAPRITLNWNQSRTIAGTTGSQPQGTRVRGTYGFFTARQFATTGVISSNNNAIFIQDSWTTLKDRLTLNLGVRAEKEVVPAYRPGQPNPIEFGYGDKTAPRLGFALDVLGNGKSKLYGSFGRFYDITKLELARGSFGGDHWVDFHFTLDTPNWPSISCTGMTYDFHVRPTCTGGTFIEAVDRRFYDPVATAASIDPNLKPMESEEITLGGQQELTPTTSLGVRWTHKNLINTIEDIGVLVNGAEKYYYGNPGEGITTNLPELDPRFPKFPKAVRKYDGYELEFTSRSIQNLSFHGTYLYSRLWGNYSGLASSDEVSNVTGIARQNPNVSRYFDSLTTSFDQNGHYVYGLLGTDRPHQLKLQAVYDFPFGTSVGLNEYVGSGTPISTEVSVPDGNLIFAYGRGDLGRTPTLTQTDLYVAHEMKFGNYGLELSVNVLNLFDEKTVTNVYPILTSEDLPLTLTQFFQGFDTRQVMATQHIAQDTLYGQPNFYQAPREIRLGAKFRF